LLRTPRGAVHNDNNGKSRPLTPQEEEMIKEAFKELANPQIRSFFTDYIHSLEDLP
jgi:hypothetical protein